MAKSLEVLLTEKWIKPEEVLSPANRIKAVKKVLYNGGESSLSVAILDYVHDGGSQRYGSGWDPLEWLRFRHARLSKCTAVPGLVRIATGRTRIHDQIMAEQNFQFRLPFDVENAAGFVRQFWTQYQH